MRVDTTGLPALIGSQQFRELGSILIQAIADHMDRDAALPLTCHRIPEPLLEQLSRSEPPLEPQSASSVLRTAIELMQKYSLHSSHPRFLGYVCPAADPMGTLAEALVASINPNAASAMMTPIGYVLEKTVVRWLATLVGLGANAGGILVSGGNMANLIGLQAAREHRAPWPIRQHGFNHPDARPLCVYATSEVHGGLEKAVEALGLGRSALHRVDTDSQGRMKVSSLKDRVAADRAARAVPICIVASIGTVATGAIDPLPEIADFARTEGIWVHVDGSYGAAMALASEVPEEFAAIPFIDSMSWDPHKWLRVPYEAGCVLLRDPAALTRTFSQRPNYYTFGDYEEVTHYYEQGPQNSRQLRALKVWVSLTQHGQRGHREFIERDLQMNRAFQEAVARQPCFEMRTGNLCITTFRYLPDCVRPADERDRTYVNNLNQAILDETQRGGNCYLSNAVVADDFLLRACFMNHATTVNDVQRVLTEIAQVGARLASQHPAMPGRARQAASLEGARTCS